MKTNDENYQVWVSVSEIVSYIEDILITYNKQSNTGILLLALDSLFKDFFSRERSAYIEKTREFFLSRGFSEDLSLEYSIKLYNMLIYIVDAFRATNNLDYMDNLYYEIISVDTVKLSYLKTKIPYAKEVTKQKADYLTISGYF